MAKIIKPHERVSIIKQTISKKKSQQDLKKEGYLTLSFRHLDKTQGNSLYEWEQSIQLAHTIEVLAGYCNDTVLNQTDGKKFTIYGNFPPPEKTDFFFPKHIPEDAEWARIHINGLQCVIGHIIHNVFYIVFLDGLHKFWKSTLKNT
ncbi:hypothetical protein K8354_16930 [Polaribacter litorisediminis]|uniref:hypothetical protein n=1 Tax=Polaribacter litorisediminis TaxID=1908341 RepID=UPI001CBC54A9|nr:hypothetical protein [Polaribacter litorisediminis]UAM97949.1 hypothetical protein K8354_16930 [Polaribacter litorisediminis]